MSYTFCVTLRNIIINFINYFIKPGAPTISPSLFLNLLFNTAAQAQNYIKMDIMDQSLVQNLLNKERKVYDTIYGFISFPKLIWEFVDTPHFQRLRNIKQLGCLAWVFPSAMHTRFEHSLGTAHLAQKYITTLIQKHSDERITKQVYRAYHEQEKTRQISVRSEATLTVTLAGLLHDVGHGPFSHLFDNKVVKKVEGQDWEHQIASLYLIDDMYEYVIGEIIKQGHSSQSKFIHWLKGTKNRVKSLIVGKITKSKYKDGKLVEKYVQNLPKQFLIIFEDQLRTRPWQFELVSNRLTGIDVDKLDYFRRDAFYLGAKNIYIDHELLMNETLILVDQKCRKQSEKYRLCYPSKYFDKVYDIYFSRYKLYKTYYFNLKANGVDFMIAEILEKSEPYFKFKEACSQLLNHKCQKYIKLTDSILEKIEDACNDLEQKIKKQKDEHKCQQVVLQQEGAEGILRAGSILRRLKRREIYDFVKEYQKSFPFHDICTFYEVQDSLKEWIKNFLDKHPNIVLNQSEIGFGIKDKNPFEECRFYDKTKADNQMQFFNPKYFSMLKPNGIVQISLRLYLKDRAKNPSAEEINQINSLVEEVEKEIKLYEFYQGQSGTYTNRRQSTGRIENQNLDTEKEKMKEEKPSSENKEF